MDRRQKKSMGADIKCGLLKKGDFIKNNRIRLTVLMLILAFSGLAGIMFGSVNLSHYDILNIILGKETEGKAYLMVTGIRLPRVLGGMMAGAGMSVAGVILQGTMNNALASPNIIGVNSGAGLAVMVALMLSAESGATVSSSAFVGALLATSLIFGISHMAGGSKITIVLAGITISSLLNAFINLIKLADREIAVDLTSFLIGSLSGITMERLFFPLCCMAVAYVAASFFMRELNILTLGDDGARALGINVGACRGVLISASSVMAGAVVSFAGLLGFVGLIVPHVCRKLFGSDGRTLLPCSALVGAAFVVVCDTFGRTVFAPYELPVGIIMSFIGAPFFIYLLIRRRGEVRNDY